MPLRFKLADSEGYVADVEVNGWQQHSSSSLLSLSMVDAVRSMSGSSAADVGLLVGLCGTVRVCRTADIGLLVALPWPCRSRCGASVLLVMGGGVADTWQRHVLFAVSAQLMRGSASNAVWRPGMQIGGAAVAVRRRRRCGSVAWLMLGGYAGARQPIWVSTD